ncbi:MAG: MFS transporter, partial [Holosporales bacterium]
RTKRTIAVIAGHVMEHYDISLYGFFAVLLAPYFFPESSAYSAQIASFGAFAAGFVMRPVGATVFGYIGDRFGRRRALIASIIFATLPTLLIGLLPTYAEIGLLAPIALMICRLAQGISVGGEFSGALVYIYEHNSHDRPAFKSASLLGAGFAGAVLGTGIGALCTADQMPAWGWRIPFILGGVLGILIYWLRRNLEETPDFQNILHTQGLIRLPLAQVLKHNGREFLCTIVFGGANLVPLYLATVYMNACFNSLGIGKSTILANNACVLLASGLLMPLVGLAADRFGLAVIMKVGLAFLGLFALPAYTYLTQDPSFESYVLLQSFLVIGNALVIAPLTSFLPRLFRPAHRYTGISVSYTLGQASLGGLTPIIASTLVAATHANWAPGLLLAGAVFVFYTALKACEGRVRA